MEGGAVCAAAAFCVSAAAAAKPTTIRQAAVRRFAGVVMGWPFLVARCARPMFNFDGRG